MNQRIKELASQCWDLRIGGQHFDQEQFAELIVKECIGIVPLMYEAKIKEHFGVEE
jgi:hypothetical protein